MVAKGGDTESCDSLDILIRKMMEATVCLLYSLQLRQPKFIIRNEDMNKKFRLFSFFNLSISSY